MLDGLRETGQFLDTDAVSKFVADPRPSVQAAALRVWASNRLDLQTLLAAMAGTSPRVAKVAAQLVNHNFHGIDYTTFADLAMSAHEWSRRAAWNCRRALSKWDRVCADLETIADPGSSLRGLASADLHAWVAHGAATTYSTPTRDQLDRIRAALRSRDIDEGLRRTIQFHAGLRQ